MYSNPAGVGTGSQSRTWLDTAKNYIEVTKPRSVFLLVFTALVAMFLATAEYTVSMSVLIKSLVAITLACSGVNAVSCYVDRDIDAIMERTKRRPIPSGRIAPPVKALVWGLVQFLLALGIAYSLNLAAFVCILMGMLGYVGIYSLLFKRKTAWNIILGGFSGGLPTMFGWMAVSGKLELLPVLLSLLVVLWIPNHIWNLAIFYKDDYRKVGVPMLPVICDTRRTLLYILFTILAMFALSIAMYYVGDMGTFYLVTAIVCGLAITAGNIYLFFAPKQKRAWFLYKLSSPYLFLIFLAMMVDRHF
ncbi:heme o synthase [Desulfoscipio gibsoniae]|uniref:Protoheme IX farnesyltransferase n=1 Tax=Desulfoscipio gibsoniae DSM 7213 TaxID=767817 RepID=R4KMD0_9FIRM|nr:heme o synthase [Desulfoscipio gibsoniae]AGL00791.1 protoheme IX farnesyltransferase [Desulfoscipio gibsoniae DSM 7213]